MRLCGVRYFDLSYEEMITALEASALFKKHGASETMAQYCIPQYPMAGRSHEILLYTAEGMGNSGYLYFNDIAKAPDVGCPLAEYSEITTLP